MNPLVRVLFQRGREIEQLREACAQLNWELTAAWSAFDRQGEELEEERRERDRISRDLAGTKKDLAALRAALGIR